jgi:hypothetical protein
VAEAAALTLALMLNPEAEWQEPEPEPKAPESEPFRRPAPQAQLRKRPVSPEEPQQMVGRVEGHVGAHFGIMPRPGVELGLGFGVAWESVSAWLLAGFGLPQEATVGQPPGAGGRLWVASAAALGCYEPNLGAARLGACLGVELSRLEGRGVGVTHPDRASIYWASATSALMVDVPLGHHLAARAAGFGLLPLARPSVFLDDIGRVHRPAPVGGKVLIGLVAKFP